MESAVIQEDEPEEDGKFEQENGYRRQYEDDQHIIYAVAHVLVFDALSEVDMQGLASAAQGAAADALENTALRGLVHKTRATRRGRRPFDVIIADEVDSMLIDDAMRPCQLSTPQSGADRLRPVLYAIWATVQDIRHRTWKDPFSQHFYTVDPYERACDGSMLPGYEPTDITESILTKTHLQYGAWLRKEAEGHIRLLLGDHEDADNEYVYSDPSGVTDDSVDQAFLTQVQPAAATGTHHQETKKYVNLTRNSQYYQPSLARNRKSKDQYR